MDGSLLADGKTPSDFDYNVRVTREVVERGQAEGELRADLEPRLASWIFYGAIEEILTGWVLGQLPGEEEDVERAVATVVGIAYAGLAA